MPLRVHAHVENVAKARLLCNGTLMAFLQILSRSRLLHPSPVSGSPRAKVVWPHALRQWCTMRAARE